MNQATETALKWIFQIGNKLGVPALFFCLAWWTFQQFTNNVMVPLANRHILFIDSVEKNNNETAATDRKQTELLSQIRTSQSEEVVRNREAVELLRDIKEHRDMN